jgi:hypothetical protein
MPPRASRARVGAACYAFTLSASNPVYTWVFARGAERLTIQRPTPVQLVVSMPGGDPRSFDYDTPMALLDFQLSFEKHLTATGWSLDAFHPERRSGTDRRRAPRQYGTERRVLPWPRAPKSDS